MAEIVGGIATSHIPSIGKAIARGLYDDPYWKEFFEGFKRVHKWLDDVRPAAAVVVYNDHGVNFFLDKMPKYSIADLIREAGAQGVEIIMWLVMRGALTGDVSEVHSSYHVPISNTASAVMVLENRTRELAEVIL